jgi:hypothetical protein
LKWHPDRNAGSEEASAKFKQVSFLLLLVPSNHPVLIISDIRSV